MWYTIIMAGTLYEGGRLVRLFIAIELPDELKVELDRLRDALSGARWVPVGQIHLTLAFLGEVDQATTAELTAQLADIQRDAFMLSLAGIGCFPDLRRPRVLWIGVKAEPKLLRLAESIQQTVLAAGISLEERPFSPHITLARFKLPAARELGAFIDQHGKKTFKSFSVREFTLFQSQLSRDGAVHIPVRNFPLINGG